MSYFLRIYGPYCCLSSASSNKLHWLDRAGSSGFRWAWWEKYDGCGKGGSMAAFIRNGSVGRYRGKKLERVHCQTVTSHFPLNSVAWHTSGDWLDSLFFPRDSNCEYSGLSFNKTAKYSFIKKELVFHDMAELIRKNQFKKSILCLRKVLCAACCVAQGRGC